MLSWFNCIFSKEFLIRIVYSQCAELHTYEQKIFNDLCTDINDLVNPGIKK